MTMTIPFTEELSETWLRERTYHAQLHNGRELSVPPFTTAMKQLMECSVPLSIWGEISQEEALVAYHQGSPVLLYGEHSWEHRKGTARAWGPNKNMRVLLFGNAREQPEAVSGTDVAVCYLDLNRGNASNTSWKQWFSSATEAFFAGSAPRAITILRPFRQFPFTTHYTVIAADGHSTEYAGHAEALRAFRALPLQEESLGSRLPTRFPQLSYYHEVTCPDGVYRLDFFGPRMDEPGYLIKDSNA
jgi:hypothetical protein